jgi:hypothetical protein
MNLTQIQHVYFIGIGGIGMSALARYFNYIGKNVAGYDKTATHLTDELIAEGIAIHFEDNIAQIPPHFYTENTLVVVTPAVPVTHAEWNYFVEREYVIKKRAEVLGIITQDTFTFAVAGTHGKTTTSAILGHILFESGVDVTAFVGGVLENYDSILMSKDYDSEYYGQNFGNVELKKLMGKVIIIVDRSNIAFLECPEFYKFVNMTSNSVFMRAPYDLHRAVGLGGVGKSDPNKH